MCHTRLDQLRVEFFVIDHRSIRGGREDNVFAGLRRVTQVLTDKGYGVVSWCLARRQIVIAAVFRHLDLCGG